MSKRDAKARCAARSRGLLPGAPRCLALAAALGFAGCAREAGPEVAPPLPPLPVDVFTVRPDPATAAEDAPGTIRPVRTAILSAKVAGTLVEVDADPGRIVKQGDVVARIDERELRARLDSVGAALEQAGSDFSRFEKLHEQRVVTAQEFEGARTRLRATQAAVDEARTLLAYCNMVAPFDGVVTRRFAQAGDLATPGKPVAEVENPEALRLEVQVPESLVARVRPGDTIAVAVNAAALTVEGKVGEIAPASDPASRTTLVKIDLPRNTALRSGMFGRARIPTDAPPSLRVPEAAVLLRGQLEFVFVVEANAARLRIVRTGRREGGHVEILSGLDAGETVVAQGAAGLTDGRAVRVP